MRSESGLYAPVELATITSTPETFDSVEILIAVPSGAYLTALSSRLSMTWWRRSGSAATGAMFVGLATFSSSRRFLARGRIISSSCSSCPARSTAVMCREIEPASTRARSRSSCAMRRTRSDSSWMIVAARVRSFSLHRLPSTSAWLKPIRLVRGVFSSCDTLARNALVFLVDDRRRPSALVLAPQAAVDQRLAEADQACQGRLQLVRHVGEEVALRLSRALDRLRHAVESRTQHPDLVTPSDPDAARVVARRNVLRRARELRERTRERAADKEDEEHGGHERGPTRFEQSPRQVAGGG